MLLTEAKRKDGRVERGKKRMDMEREAEKKMVGINLWRKQKQIRLIIPRQSLRGVVTT